MAETTLFILDGKINKSTLSNLRKKFIDELITEILDGYELYCYLELGFDYFEPHNNEEYSEFFNHSPVYIIETPFRHISHKNPEIKQITLCADWLKKNIPKDAKLFFGGDSEVFFTEYRDASCLVSYPHCGH